MSNAYEKSGVDVQKGYESVERIKKHVASTLRSEVMSGLGSFGALFKLDLSKYKEPILVSGTDGVGTKILLAQNSNKLDTIGIDCVAMCVNDILAQGAEPLFFLDYLAVGKNHPEKIEQIVSGVAKGCKLSNASLVGGETAEMPDLYDVDEFDLAGFCVGITDKAHMLDGSKVKEGDILIGLKSSGIHSNGFSLVRKLFFKDNDYKFDTVLENGETLIDTLLTPTKIYVKDVLPLLDKGLINGISHITGGGFDENIPRMFSKSLSARVDLKEYEIPFIFNLMMELGKIDKKEMFNIFNMGIGMVLAVCRENVDEVLKSIESSQILGEIVTKKESNLEMIF